MPAMTSDERRHYRARIVNALLPDRKADITRANDAAWKAALLDYFGAAGLKQIAKMPDHWLSTVEYIRAQMPDGTSWDGRRTISLYGKARLPRRPADDWNYGTEATAAILHLVDLHTTEAHERDRLNYEVGQVLDRSRTIEQLLEKLPAARDILALPASAPVEDIATRLNAQMASKAKQKQGSK